MYVVHLDALPTIANMAMYTKVPESQIQHVVFSGAPNGLANDDQQTPLQDYKENNHNERSH